MNPLQGQIPTNGHAIHFKNMFSCVCRPQNRTGVPTSLPKRTWYPYTLVDILTYCAVLYYIVLCLYGNCLHRRAQSARSTPPKPPSDLPPGPSSRPSRLWDSVGGLGTDPMRVDSHDSGAFLQSLSFQGWQRRVWKQQISPTMNWQRHTCNISSEAGGVLMLLILRSHSLQGQYSAVLFFKPQYLESCGRL